MKKLNIKGKLVWYGYGMSIYFDSDTDSYTILYDDDELIGSDLTAMEVKLFYNGVVNMINATTPHPQPEED